MEISIGYIYMIMIIKCYSNGNKENLLHISHQKVLVMLTNMFSILQDGLNFYPDDDSIISHDIPIQLTITNETVTLFNCI